MGFEQLAALKAQLAAQAKEKAAADKPPAKAKPAGAKPAGKGQGRGGAKANANPNANANANPNAKASHARQAAKAEPVDPVIESIRRLQKQFPRAFPKKPEPKLPLKLGIMHDLVAQQEKLGLDEAQLKEALATWCKGSRYWSCMVTGAPRVDLQGNPDGEVTAAQAERAKWLASRGPRRQGADKGERRGRGPRDGSAKQAEAKPAEAKPAEAKPAEAKPAEAKPAEAQTVEAQTVEVAPTAAGEPSSAPTQTTPPQTA